MQNPIKHSVLACLMTSLLAHGVLAQAPSAPGGAGRSIPADPAAPEFRRLESTLYTLISVDFEGGTVADYIATIKGAARRLNVDVNVICPAEARDVKVSSISLNSVSLNTAVEALCTAFASSSEYRFDVTVVGKGANEFPTFALRFLQERRQPQGPGATPANQNGGARDDGTMIEVIAVRDVIEPPPGMPANDSTRTAKEVLLKALDAAVSLRQDAKAPDVLFHEETGLLIVRGTVEQNALATSVINRIRDDLQRRRAQILKLTDGAASRTRRVASMNARVEVARAEHEEAKASLDRAMKLRDQGTVPDELVSKLRLDVVRSAGKLTEATADLEQAQAEANDATVPEPGDGEASSGGGRTLFVYDVKDLQTPTEELVRLATLLAGPGAKVEVMKRDAGAREIIVQAEESRQKDVQLLFTTLRGGKPGGAAPAPSAAPPASKDKKK